jgi:hypothetical protein
MEYFQCFHSFRHGIASRLTQSLVKILCVTNQQPAKKTNDDANDDAVRTNELFGPYRVPEVRTVGSTISAARATPLDKSQEEKTLVARG